MSPAMSIPPDMYHVICIKRLYKTFSAEFTRLSAEFIFGCDLWTPLGAVVSVGGCSCGGDTAHQTVLPPQRW